MHNTHFAFYPYWSVKPYTHAVFIFLFSDDLGQHSLDTDSPVRQAQVEGALEFAGIQAGVMWAFGRGWEGAGRHGIELRDRQFNTCLSGVGKHQLGIVKPGRGAGGNQVIETRHLR